MANLPIVFNASHFIATPSGNWSVFDIGVGTPPQNFSVLVSTVDDSVILPFYNGGSQTQGLFNSNDSTSWQLNYSETSFDVVIVGPYSMSLAVTADNSVPPLLGIVMDSDADLLDYGIPSQSLGYSAGAAYRNAPASLVLGGYDETGIAALGPSFNLSSSYIMNVTLTNLTATKTFDRNTSLLPSSVFMLLDSSVEDLYMPTVICDRFVSAFGLISNDSDPSSRSFTVNSSTHQQLRQFNSLITFTIGDPNEPSTSVDIVLSYKSLDSVAGNSSNTSDSIHFPLRDVGDVLSGTLGRRFFQEIYAIVDYSRGNFSISQAAINTDPNHMPKIIAISEGDLDGPETFIESPGGTGLVVVGVILAIGLIISAACYGNWRFRKYRAKPQRERREKLDQIWIQIHTVKSDEDCGEEEEEQEVENYKSREQVRLLDN